MPTNPSRPVPPRKGPPAGRARSITVSIRAIVVPALRQRAFDGKLPHLRRVGAEGTSTFALQISKWGGEFIIELGRVAAGPYRTLAGEVIDAAELTSFHLRLADRARLRAVPRVLQTVWFRYAPTTVERVQAAAGRLLGKPAPMSSLEGAAHQVLALLPECDRWWAGENGLPHVRSYAEQERAQDEGAARR